MGYGVNVLPLTFFPVAKLKKLVGSLQVTWGAIHYRCGQASHHGVRRRWFVMNLTVRPKGRLTVLRKVQLLPVYNLT